MSSILLKQKFGTSRKQQCGERSPRTRWSVSRQELLLALRLSKLESVKSTTFGCSAPLGEAWKIGSRALTSSDLAEGSHFIRFMSSSLDVTFRPPATDMKVLNLELFFSFITRICQSSFKAYRDGLYELCQYLSLPAAEPAFDHKTTQISARD